MQEKSLFKNTIYKAILSFVNILAPVIIGSYVVKLLNVELYGIYNAVYSEFQVFLTIASFGIYNYGVREISKIRDDKEKVKSLFTSLCIISFLTNFIVTIIYVFYSIFASEGIKTIIYLLMIIQFFANMIYIEFVNESLENYKFITIKSVIVKLLYMVALFVFVRKPSSIIPYTIVVSISVFLNNFISFLYAKKRIGLSFKKIEIKRHLPALFTLLIISDIGILYSQLDKIMLGKLVNDVSVTMYYIPYYLMGMLASIPYAIINVSIPRLSYIVKNKPKEEYEERLKISISTLWFVILPMCFGVIALARETIILYAGEKYVAMVPTLIVSCIARIVFSANSIMTNLVSYPNDQEKKILKYTALFGFANLGMNYLLVLFKVFNPSTALATTAIAELGLAIVQYIYSIKKLKLKIKIFTKQNLTYLALSAMFIPISLLIRMLNLGFGITTISIIAICVIFYALVLFIIKDSNMIFTFDKVKNILKVVKK
jgi:O-antigen/teichoic acid export membrane protein